MIVNSTYVLWRTKYGVRVEASPWFIGTLTDRLNEYGYKHNSNYQAGTHHVNGRGKRVYSDAVAICDDIIKQRSIDAVAADILNQIDL